MINEIKIEQMFIEHGLTEEARNYVRFAREHSPVNEIDQRFGNCIVMQYSQKMGRHLELSSRTVVAPAATLTPQPDAMRLPPSHNIPPFSL